MSRLLLQFGKAVCFALAGMLCLSVHAGTPEWTNLAPPERTSILADVIAAPQQRSISGIVTGEEGEPLPGANVVIKGTTIGTTTDFNGAYTLMLAANTETLVISYIGYEPVEVSIQGRTQLDVSLKPDLKTLQEVVVVGYGTQRKSDVTGSVASVKGTELAQLPMQRVDQALQGRAAGVMVLNTSGQPGGQTTIRIRGMNSIQGSNQPLIVVDGLQGVDINSLNPNDIESMEILKDASATAIYGSQGANGVILITTKKGKKGNPVVNYSFNQSYQKLRNKLDLMNAPEFVSATNAYRASLNMPGNDIIVPTPVFSQQEVDDWNGRNGTDWQEEVYRTAPMSSHQLSLSGGTDNVNYLVSGGFLDQEGILLNSQFQRFTLRANVNVKVTEKTSFGLSWAGIKEKGNTPPFGEGAADIDPLGQVVGLTPRWAATIPVYDANGVYQRHPPNFGEPNLWNPVASALEPVVENNSMRSNVNAFVEFKPLEGLSIRFTGGAVTRNTNNFRYLNRKTHAGFQRDGSGLVTEGTYARYQNSNIITYEREINAQHRFTITGVAEQQLETAQGSSIEASDFLVDNTGVFDLGGAQEKFPTSYKTRRAINSYLGRLNYSFKDRYLLTASYRADGSSVFGANNKWGYFPSASVAWRASEESFLRDLNIFSDFKIRASWGATGNQAISPYGTLAQITSGFNYPYYGNDATNIGFLISRPANPNLKWETTTQTDLGVEFAVLNGRLTAGVDYYVKTTEDLLLSRQLHLYSGFSTLIDNVGSTQNKGIEISLGGDPFVGDFKWNTAFNISFNKTEVVQLANSNRLPFRTTTGGGYGFSTNNNTALLYLKAGEPFGQMSGWITEGTWKESERAQAAEFGQLPGDIKYRDMNDDKRINNSDVTVIGNALPDFIFGWTNNFSYKSFDLAVLIQGVQGNEIFNAGRIRLERPGEGTSRAMLNRWTQDNQNTDVPAFIDQSVRREAALTNRVTVDSRLSRWVEDASYIRLKNVTLGYTLPGAIASKVGVNRVRAFVTGTNVFTITDYTGYDPEISSFNSSDATLGIDFGSYPTSKTITFGIDLSF